MRELEKQQIELETVVELAHRHLGPDLAYIAEFTLEGQVHRAVAGDAASFKIVLDKPITATTYSIHLGVGECPQIVQDARKDERVARLGITQEWNIGSFIGVPLRFSDGTLYGTFCCVSHEPNPELGQKDVRFMSLLGELIVHRLDELRRQQELRTGILSLIETENVALAYQPIFDLATDKCIGVEALARFPEPFTRPDWTFAAADEFGLGLKLEELVVRRAWTALEHVGSGQFLALNLTPATLLALARKANQDADTSFSSVVVEITEHTAVERYADLRHELDQLRRRGLRLAVDDAGAGYASLRHILELRPDIIKLDRSIIHGVAEDRARCLVVSSFVNFAGDLDATVVAEGIEEPADLDAVRELGLHAAQGYLLGRPSTDPDDLRAWLQSGTRQTRSAA